jgi:4-methyl-5(b-hydroxyethyl)-thiazole monophosphate biosynthesis
MGDYIYTGRPVEQDGNLITGIGAGLSIDFGIRLARVLTDRETVELLKKRMEIRSCNTVDASSSTRTE